MRIGAEGCPMGTRPPTFATLRWLTTRRPRAKEIVPPRRAYVNPARCGVSAIRERYGATYAPLRYASVLALSLALRSDYQIIRFRLSIRYTLNYTLHVIRYMLCGPQTYTYKFLYSMDLT